MPKTIQIKQNTEEWRLWRTEGLGGSEAPIILGMSPYKTREKLLDEKVRRLTAFEVTSAMQRGHNLEPKARDKYQRESLLIFPATTMEHEEYPYIKASLDGFNEENNVALEIKCPNRYDHLTAKAGFIPDKYKAQCQHLLMVSGANSLHYVSFDGEFNASVLVRPDEDFQKVLLEEEIRFWEEVQAMRTKAS